MITLSLKPSSSTQYDVYGAITDSLRSRHQVLLNLCLQNLKLTKIPLPFPTEGPPEGFGWERISESMHSTRAAPNTGLVRRVFSWGRGVALCVDITALKIVTLFRKQRLHCKSTDCGAYSKGGSGYRPARGPAILSQGMEFNGLTLCPNHHGGFHGKQTAKYILVNYTDPLTSFFEPNTTAMITVFKFSNAQELNFTKP